MARRATPKTGVNSKLQKGQRRTQRERLILGVIAAAAKDGYAGATVSAIIEQAGVSRPTFYDYFEDRDGCFLAAIAETHGRLGQRVRRAVDAARGEDALTGAITGLVELAREDTLAARFLMNEPLAAGAAALDLRDRGIREIQKTVEAAEAKTAKDAERPDLPIAIALGAAHRLIGSALRRGDPGLSGLEAGLHEWIRRYNEPADQHRWRKLQASKETPVPPHGLPATPSAPAPIPPGRPRLNAEQVAENQRGRILLAVSELSAKNGYEHTTVAQIAKRAKLDVSVFYVHFPGKQDAFMAYHENAFQLLMGATAGAFFAGRTWPERSWDAGRAFTWVLSENPTIAHVGFVDAYAIGPGAVQRVDDSHTAFAIFLQEGYEHVGGEGLPGRVAVEAIVSAIYELVYVEVRGQRTRRLPRMLAAIANLYLTPFLGPAETWGFVEARDGPGPATASRRATAR